MKRFLLAAMVLAAPAFAHHGWSSFDQDRPYYLQGTVKSVRWANPHAEAVLEVKADVAVPADLATRPLPKQSQNVDAAASAGACGGVADRVRAAHAHAGMGNGRGAEGRGPDRGDRLHGTRGRRRPPDARRVRVPPGPRRRPAFEPRELGPVNAWIAHA